MAISYGTYTITEVQEGSQIWTTTVAPKSPNYTFTISNLTGDSDTSVKVGDIIMYSYYRYTVLSISSNGTTVLTGNRTSIRGGTGAASTTYSLIVSNLAIVKDKSGTISPTSITLTAKYQTGSSAMANYSGRFKIETTTDNSTWTTQYTSSANENTKNWSVIDDIVAIRCSLYLKDGTTTLLDQQTIPIVSDGIDGTNGTNGKDAYTVILTNENHTFAGDTTSVIASEIECNVIAYKGATQVASTIGTITGQPTGMTTALLNNGTINTAFKITVTTSMITQNGVLTIPITVDGKTFTKKFTYALTLNGEKGDTAQWYYGDSLTHTSGTATLPISQTADVIVGAMYLNTKTGICYKCTAISGSNVTWTYAGNITDGIEIGGRNLIIGTLHPDARSGGIYRPHIFGQISNTAGRGTCTVAEHGIRFTNTTANWQYIYFGNSGTTATPCMLGLEAGETYTLSADLSWNILSSDTGKADTTTNYMGAALAYSNTESGSFTGLPHNKQFAITQTDKGTDMSGRLIYTFTVPETAKKLYLGIVSDNKTASHYAIGDYIEARNLKLEKGNKATDWTPAPEDIDAEISTKADSTDAVFEEQLIYISKASGTLSVDGTTTWITENGDVQNTWSTKRPTYDTNYPVLFIAKQRKTVSGTVTCTTPLKDDTTTIIDGGHITTGTIDASQVSVTNIDASNISTGTLSANRIGANSIDASKIDVSSISIGNLNGASNYAQKTDIGWSVLINVSSINFINNTATLHATVYKDGSSQSSGFTLQWYKTATSENTTTTTLISGATSDVLSVTDLNASYTCVVN